MSEHNISVEGGTSVRLLTAGKYCDGDIVVTATANTSESEEHAALIKSLIERTITEFDVPKHITEIGASAFNACQYLKTIRMHDGITAIKSFAFNSCRRLELKEIPAGIQTLEGSVIPYCASITELTFKGTPTTIHEEAFKNCTTLKTINVPWAEGEVANAPWSATNATINYNYTGG